MMAAIARQFELAFMALAEEGQIDLSTVDPELAEWDKAVADVYVYTTLGDGKRAPGDAAGAKKLEKAYAALEKARDRVMKALGDLAALVDAREGDTEVNPAMLRPPEPAALPSNFVTFTGEVSSASLPMRKPVTAEEIRNRTTAEQKVLPESRSLGALLAILPSDWVTSIADQLGLMQDEDMEMTVGTRSAAWRGKIFNVLKDRDAFKKVLDLLDADERAIIRELLEAGGTMPYKRLCESFPLDESDGFYWNQRPPAGPLAALRRRALAFVGTHNGFATVAIPADLPFAELLPPAG